jgi:hypothetical protein
MILILVGVDETIALYQGHSSPMIIKATWQRQGQNVLSTKILQKQKLIRVQIHPFGVDLRLEG